MDVKQLKYFVHVAELGSFSKASAFLSIAQPALSRQVRNLEGELGATLLYRNGRGVSVTESGDQLLRHAKAILEQMERARNEVAAVEGEPQGAVILGMPPTVSQVLVTPLIKHFRSHYPQISLKVVEGFSGHVHEWLVQGRLDVALLYNAPKTRHLITEELLIEELFLISPPAAAEPGTETVRLAALSDLPLILPSRPHGLRLLVDTVAADADVALSVDVELDALSAIKELVEDGAGYTILPYASVHREVAEGRLAARRIVGPPISRSLLLASSTQQPISAAARAVMQQIKGQVRDLVDTGNWLGTTQTTA